VYTVIEVFVGLGRCAGSDSDGDGDGDGRMGWDCCVGAADCDWSWGLVVYLSL
jgi:hypothetical protein